MKLKFYTGGFPAGRLDHVAGAVMAGVERFCEKDALRKVHGTSTFERELVVSLAIELQHRVSLTARFSLAHVMLNCVMNTLGTRRTYKWPKV